MKKLFFLFIALLFAALSHSQPCFPDGISFQYQSQVDNFQSLYPECNVIEGNVYIGGQNIQNLQGLSILTEIWGDLSISSTSVQDLSGLENITSVGGYLKVSDNDNLSSLSGLDSLTFVGDDIRIEYNNILENLNTLSSLMYIGESLFIYYNLSLKNLSGLEGLDSLPGSLYVYRNDSLNSLNGLQGISYAWRVTISQNPALNDLEGLDNLDFVQWDFTVIDNENLEQLSGLESLDSIGGDFFISNNSNLTTLSGLSNLSTVGRELTIIDNPVLTNLSGLTSLTHVTGNLHLSDNPMLNNISGFNGVSIDSGLLIQNNSSLAVCEENWLCDYLANANGTVLISDNAEGCNSVIEAAAACGGITCLPYGDYIFLSQEDVDNFQSAFTDCSDVSGSIIIRESNVSDLSGLNNVKSIGGNLVIYNNHELLNLSGLDSLNHIGGGLEIGKANIGGNYGLESLTGLENLSFVGGYIDILLNPELISLYPISNVDGAALDSIRIKQNPLISFCAIESICEFLGVSNAAKFQWNHPGCNSQQEVENGCLNVAVEEVAQENNFRVFPNPASSEITIERNSNTEAVLSIIDLQGRQLIRQTINSSNNIIDIRVLPAGVYFVHLLDDNNKFVQKLMKN